MVANNPTALVVGAGIGGIAAAARLARHGYQVTAVEKRGGPGGRCSRLEVDGHQFTTGPSLLVMREVYEQTFADLGERLEDHLDLRRIDPSYHIQFGDNSTLALTSDLDVMRTQLETKEAGSFDGYLRYLAEGSEHYRLAMPHLVQRNFRNLFEFANPANLLMVPRLKVLKKHYRHVGKYFKDPRLKAAFTFQDMYMGMSPNSASALFSMLQYSEFADGVWFPMGGMHRVIEALTNIAENLGVQFRYNAPVERIKVNGRQATSVVLESGDRLFADVVVANADLPYVYRALLPHNGSPDKFERKNYGFSAVVFYWGVDRHLPNLKPHNLFLTDDFPECLDTIFDDPKNPLPCDPPFYLHAPSRVDPSLAPKGGESLMAAVPVGLIDITAKQDWADIRARARAYVLQRLWKFEGIDLEKHIRAEVCHSPPCWQHEFNLIKGSTHGLSHALSQLAYLRPPNRHPRYRNLYFTGASTHPGTGLPTVQVSARLVVERILEDAPSRECLSIFSSASIS
jgi:phytoene desaturase